MIGLVQFLPLFLLTLVAGYVADRVDRRWIVRISLAVGDALRRRRSPLWSGSAR